MAFLRASASRAARASSAAAVAAATVAAPTPASAAASPAAASAASSDPAGTATAGAAAPAAVPLRRRHSRRRTVSPNRAEERPPARLYSRCLGAWGGKGGSAGREGIGRGLNQGWHPRHSGSQASRSRAHLNTVA